MRDYLAYLTGAIILLVTTSFIWRHFRRRSPHCPVCLRLGHASHYGRYRCTGCGADFILNEARRPAPTLWQGAVGPFVTRMIVWLSLLGLTLWYGSSLFATAMIGLIMLVDMSVVFVATRGKRFVIHGDGG